MCDDLLRRRRIERDVFAVDRREERRFRLEHHRPVEVEYRSRFVGHSIEEVGSNILKDLRVIPYLAHP